MQSRTDPSDPPKGATIIGTKNNIPAQDPTPNLPLGIVCPKDFNVLITNGLQDLNRLVMKYMELLNKHHMYQLRADAW
jgi:hypothetical protein